MKNFEKGVTAYNERFNEFELDGVAVNDYFQEKTNEMTLWQACYDFITEFGETPNDVLANQLTANTLELFVLQNLD